MHLFKIIPAFIIALNFLSFPAAAQEYIFPQSSPLSATYELSSDSLQAGDTLIVTRTIFNGGQTAVEGLYLMDNLPPHFRLLNYSVTIDNQPTPVLFTGPSNNEVVPGFACYRWIIDLPDSLPPYDRLLAPGETLVLTCKLTCVFPGHYQFPLHDICGYAGSEGFFSVAVAIEIDIYAGECLYVPGDANGDDYCTGMDVVYLVNFLKGGPDPPVICNCGNYGYLGAASDANGDCAVNGLDVFFILNYCKGGSLPLYCTDCPPQ